MACIFCTIEAVPLTCNSDDDIGELDELTYHDMSYRAYAAKAWAGSICWGDDYGQLSFDEAQNPVRHLCERMHSSMMLLCVYVGVCVNVSVEAVEGMRRRVHLCGCLGYRYSEQTDDSLTPEYMFPGGAWPNA